MSKRVSPEMLRVLRQIKKDGTGSCYSCKCSLRTFLALCDRKLIRVETTLGSIAFPRNARATLTDAGNVAAFQL